MAAFSSNTLTQVSGYDNEIISGELVYHQKTYWNLSFAANGSPVDLTGATIDAQILRREVSNIIDTRAALSFTVADYTPTPSPIALTTTNLVSTSGLFTLVIDDTAWGLMTSDPELDISLTNPIAFSGRIKISFPAVGTTPENDIIIFLLFLVRSDGVVN